MDESYKAMVREALRQSPPACREVVEKFYICMEDEVIYHAQKGMKGEELTKLFQGDSFTMCKKNYNFEECFKNNKFQVGVDRMNGLNAKKNH